MKPYLLTAAFCCLALLFSCDDDSSANGSGGSGGNVTGGVCQTPCENEADQTSCTENNPISCSCNGTTTTVQFYGCIDNCCDNFEDLTLEARCERAQILCD